MSAFEEREEVAPSGGERKRSLLEVLLSEKNFKWALLIPLLVVLAVFLFYPLIYSAFYSMQEWGGWAPPTAVGLENFRQVLHDNVFWVSLGRTFEVLAICIAAELSIGMGIAMLWNREFKGQNVVRGLVLLPLLVSPLILSLLWNFMLQYNYGAINISLEWMGFGKFYFWDPRWALFTICGITIWQWFPFSTFVLIAGLKSMPKDVFEAAKVDGASAWYTFRKLTLPMLTPLIMIVVMLRVMWLMRLFDPLFGTTRGGVNTELLDWMVYRTSFVYFDVGVGSTLGLISLFLTLIFCAILFRELIKALGVAK
jgi:multiple sugar transport system permease protein